MGPDVFRQMPRGSFDRADWSCPSGDEWLLSGMTNLLPSACAHEIYLPASELAIHFPELVFRNPEKLERAWELQRQQRQHFIEFFGDDLVVLPGHELDCAHAGLFRVPHVRGARRGGKTAADHAREIYGVEPPPIDAPLPDDFRRAETVGVICDDIEGLNYYINFGMVAEIFATRRWPPSVAPADRWC